MTEQNGQGWQPPGGPPPPGPEGDSGEARSGPDSPWAVPGGSAPPPSAGGSHPGAPPHPAPGYGAPGHGGPWRPAPPRPGVIALRPLTLGDVFNGAFSYVRHNPKAVLGWSVIVALVVSLLPSLSAGSMMSDVTRLSEELAQGSSASEFELAPFSPFAWITQVAGWLVNVIGSAFLTGLLAGIVGVAVLGQKVTMGQSLALVRRRIGGVLGVAGLMLLIALGWLALIVGIIVAGVLLIDVSGVAAAVVILVGLVALAVAAAWVYVRTALSMPVVVLEGVGPARALARSWRLSRGSWWRLFGILILAAILGSMVASVLATPFSLVGTFTLVLMPGDPLGSVVYTATLFLGTVLGTAITSPFVAGVTTLLYVDLRMRREGLDLRLQAATQSGETVDQDVYLPEPSPAFTGAAA